MLTTLLAARQAVPVVPVANGATPTSMLNNLAVKREWTLQDNEFYKARATTNAANAYPSIPKAKLKYIKTFSFRSMYRTS